MFNNSIRSESKEAPKYLRYSSETTKQRQYCPYDQQRSEKQHRSFSGGRSYYCHNSEEGSADRIVRKFDALFDQGKIHEAVVVVKGIKYSNIESEHDLSKLFATVIKRHVEVGNLGAGKANFDDMKRSDLSAIYKTLIKGYAQSGNMIRAEMVKFLMKNMGYYLDRSSLHALLEGYIVKKGLLGTPKMALQKVAEEGTVPNRSTYHFLLKCFVRIGKMAEAEETLDQMKTNGCIPILGSYTVLVKECVRAEDTLNAKRWLTHAAKYDKNIPDHFLIDIKLALGLEKEALKVYKERLEPVISKPLEIYGRWQISCHGYGYGTALLHIQNYLGKDAFRDRKVQIICDQREENISVNLSMQSYLIKRLGKAYPSWNFSLDPNNDRGIIARYIQTS